MLEKNASDIFKGGKIKNTLFLRWFYTFSQWLKTITFLPMLMNFCSLISKKRKKKKCVGLNFTIIKSLMLRGKCLGFSSPSLALKKCTIVVNIHNIKFTPWPVWLNWLGIVTQSEMSQVRFPVRARAWVAGFVVLQVWLLCKWHHTVFVFLLLAYFI